MIPGAHGQGDINGGAPQFRRQADVQAAFCNVLCDEWYRSGVAEAFVSPGSRSTPIVAALQAQTDIRVSVVLDERSSGFAALGAALASSRPVIAVTTSGTAAVEMHPAVVEASQAGVALIVVTADRPAELHEVGAPQTVDQQGLYGRSVRWAFEPGVADLASAAAWRSVASRAVAEALDAQGPVHLNLAFREPLLGDATAVTVPAGRPQGRPWHAAGSRGWVSAPDPAVVELIGSHRGKRGLLVAGEGAAASEAERSAVLAVAETTGWPLLADPRSGLRVEHPHVIAGADLMLRSDIMKRLEVEFVLRIGAPWSSKVLNSWLGGLDPEVPQVLVDPRGRWADPERIAWQVSTANAISLAGALGAHKDDNAPGLDGEWLSIWKRADAVTQATLDDLLSVGKPLEMSEPAIARAVSGSIDAGCQLFVSSSMPVRDVEWFGPARCKGRVMSNRGANGIDGVLSSALGAAIGAAKPTVALMGDLAFVYDAGALLWASSRPAQLSVVVVDNDGGGIFSFLDYSGAMPAERFERYWGTAHGLDLVALARAYGVEATRLGTRQELDRFLETAVRPEPAAAARVGVVSSDRRRNVADHDQLVAAVDAALSAEMIR